jgi:UDP-3-O-[3-hydroxymyristoyl] glucosamine N-acyltransferase
MEFTAEQIASVIGGRVEGNKDAKINTFAKIEEGVEGAISFLSNPKYTHYIYDTKSSVVIVNNDVELEHPVQATLIRVDNAYECIAKLLQIYEASKPKKTGVAPQAYVSPTAKLGKDCYVGPFACIGDNAVVGDNCQIYPHAVIGDNVKMGDNCLIYPNTTIYQGCKLGNNVTLHAGSVIGSDGFGFAPNAEGYDKIPQIGIVTIEDNVEIGANTCVDRSTMGSTFIRKGVKLDNLVQIAHNVEIGENTVMSAQVGIAGRFMVYVRRPGWFGRPHHNRRPHPSRSTVGRTGQLERQRRTHRHTADATPPVLQVAGYLPSSARYVQGLERPEKRDGVAQEQR